MQKLAMRCAVVLTVLISRVAGGAEPDRPNIVFLMADDQSKYSMGCYDTPNARTPHLDKLANDGMVFDRYYTTTAICMASRATAVTGLVEYKHGCNFTHGPLTQEHWSRSYPILLRQAGYRTAIAGKIGFEVTDQPGQKSRLPQDDFDSWGAGPSQTSYVTRQNRSMKQYAEKYPHSTRSYGAFGRDFVMESKTDDRPFCLSISFKAPHHPVQPDPVDDEVFRGDTFSKPGNYGREFGEHFSLQSRQGRQFERFNSWKYRDKYDQTIALYFQQIYAIDVAVGMIRTALDEAGVAKNTVVIYTSDNGFMNGAHGYGSKVLPYEESSCVPMIVFDPRHANSGKQLRCDGLTANVDIAPTILDCAGLEIPDHYDGRSLMALYDDPEAEVHDSLPLINVWGPPAVHSFAVVTAKSKYIVWPHSKDDMVPTEELYDMVGDRLELANLADTAQERLDQMRTVYDEWITDWKTRRVDYHNYAVFGDRFDRRKLFSEKPAGDVR